MLNLKKFVQTMTLSSFVFGLVAANANIAATIQPSAKSSPVILAQVSPQEKSVVESNNFRFQLQNCQRDAQRVTCSFLITNLISVDRSIVLYGSSSSIGFSRIIDFFGREFFVQAVQVGSSQGTSRAAALFVQGIPLRASVTFQLPQEVTQIALLEVKYYINDNNPLLTAAYRNVNIVDPNSTPEPTPVEPPTEPACNCSCPSEN